MTQGDEKELGEIARSIEALFTRKEVLETTEAVASGGAAQRHPDVATALGLEGALDAATDPDLAPAPRDTSEADLGTPADVEDREGTPIEAEPEADPVTAADVENREGTPIEAEPEADLVTAADVEDREGTPIEAEPEADPVTAADVEDREGTPIGAEPEADPVTAADVEDREGTPIGAEPEADPVTPADVEDREGTSIEAEPELSETGQALSEATSQYLEAPTHKRGGAQRVLRSAVEASRSAGAFGEIASSVNALFLRGAGDSDVWVLAEEFIDEDVMPHMVVQLGLVRDEEERGVFIQAYERLGDPAAEAIADALTDTEDRSARKTYVTALGAFDTAGAHAVEKMLEDSRWFVVRNGVSVLGVVGEPSAIEHLTGSLAHPHAKVRRETVRSLAKIGGENAGLLVSSMLGDSDAIVRAAAARAISVLKVERGYKQLLEILEKGDEEVVIEHVLRALGALGDPSAVSAIEKQVKRSIFSRPPKGVRLAGLAALAAIGTPHAMGLVKKARTDKDPEISSVAVKLLSGK